MTSVAGFWKKLCEMMGALHSAWFIISSQRIEVVSIFQVDVF